VRGVLRRGKMVEKREGEGEPRGKSPSMGIEKTSSSGVKWGDSPEEKKKHQWTEEYVAKRRDTERESAPKGKRGNSKGRLTGWPSLRSCCRFTEVYTHLKNRKQTWL